MCNRVQGGTYMILIQRMFEYMLYNGHKLIYGNKGGSENISEECFVRGNIRKCADSFI